MFISFKVPLFSLFLLSTAMQSCFANCNNIVNQDVQNIIDNDLVKYKIPGAQVSLACVGEDLPRDFVSGASRIDASGATETMTPEKLFQIGDDSASFVTIRLLKLEAERKLSLEDPIGRYLYLDQIPNAWKNITIKQLLNHTSGIPDYTQLPGFYEEMLQNPQTLFSAQDLVNRTVNIPLYDPAAWHNSTTNTVLAGMIIQAITKNNVADELQKYLFETLHLNHTHDLSVLTYDENILNQMAHGYALRTPEAPWLDTTGFNTSWTDASEGIVSNAHDMALWLKNLFVTLPIPKKQWQEMLDRVDFTTGKHLTPRKEQKIPGAGLGLWYEYDPNIGEIWYRLGMTLGYTTQMSWLRCRNVGISVFINENNTPAVQAIAHDLASYAAEKSPCVFEA